MKYVTYIDMSEEESSTGVVNIQIISLSRTEWKLYQPLLLKRRDSSKKPILVIYLGLAQNSSVEYPRMLVAPFSTHRLLSDIPYGDSSPWEIIPIKLVNPTSQQQARIEEIREKWRQNQDVIASED